jgi:hypothetical protein
MKKLITAIPLCLSIFGASFAWADFQSLEDVISGIDELLREADRSNGFVDDRVQESQSFDSLPEEPQPLPEAIESSINRPFRADNELLPPELINTDDPVITPPVSTEAIEDLPTETARPVSVPVPSADYSNMSIEDLLNEVDMLEKPTTGLTTGFVDSLPSISEESPGDTSEELLIPIKEVSQTPKANNVSPLQSVVIDEEPTEILVDDYMVLGSVLDPEMMEKVRECIMATRMASGGSGNPYVTRSVYKATSYCNRVLGRLSAPAYKRYRRDILLSLINMHEKNQAWVDAAKSYERFLEEFASDDNYPFEQHEDAPGIPALNAPLADVTKLLEGFKRGAPTIPETHIRVGKIYRALGADRMALNKFYDAINATLTLPYNSAFIDAEKRRGRSFEERKDEEANQAMFEIAETFLQGEDYNNAIKFYDRLNRLEQLKDSDRAVVVYKRALAHFRRAVNTRKSQESNTVASNEAKFDETPRADFAKVKEILRGYATLYPSSLYVPETFYLLALSYEELNQDEESIAQLLSLLKETNLNPNDFFNDESQKPSRDRNEANLAQTKAIWNFWKKKTGNFLANKFFENGEYFNSYRIYTALRPIDDSMAWQVPIMYQIALCEEKLGNYVQAIESYIAIEDFVRNSSGAAQGLAKSKYLNFVYGMAKWRRDQLEDTREIRQAVNRYGIYSSPTSSPDFLEN